MKIFKDEVKAGLAEEIQAKAKIAFASQTTLVSDSFADVIRSYASEDIISNISEQKDLAPIQSILVSTGWNANSDIFTPEQVWASRNSPVNKQVNLEHSDKIIGHMVSSAVLDFNRNLIADDTPFENVPKDFDVLTAAVLYKKHPNEELRKAVAELIPKIANGEAFVSMECYFNDFDYGLRNSDGDSRIVARNEDTAWLTKHLRQFGGQGEYNGYTLGRVIKNLTFSGKGVVSNPANKRSIIFSDMKSFSNASVVDNTNFINANEIKEEEENMSEKTVSVESYDALKAELAQFKKERDEEIAAKLSEHEATIDTLKEEKAELQTANEKLTEELKAAKEEGESVAKASQEELDSAKEELETANKKLAEIEAKSIRVERIGNLISVGETEESASEIVDEWSDASDEKFAKIVKMREDVIKAQANAASDDDSEEDDDTNASLDVEEEEDVVPNVEEEDAHAETLALASDFLDTVMRPNK